MKKLKHRIQSEGFEIFFYSGSRWVVFVPIVVLMVALMLKLGQTAKIIGTRTNLASPSPSVSSGPTTKNNPVDLKGPYVCDYENDQVKVAAYIKNGKAQVSISNKTGKAGTEKIYFDGDCLFMSGEKKTCGLKSYVSVFEGMIGSNSTILDNLSSKYLKEKVDASTLLDACKKKNFEDSVFK